MTLLTPLAPVSSHFGRHIGMVRRTRGWVRPEERRPHHVCWRHLALDADQRRILERVPDPGGPVPPVLLCRRRADHLGPHLAEGAESLHDELAYWLTWGEIFWRIFPARYCGLRLDRPAYVSAELDFCSLPRRHRGAHTSQYFPLDLRWPYGVRLDVAGYQHRPPATEGG